MDEEEYSKALRQFHKLSPRHVLVAETDMTAQDAQKVFALSEKIRKAGNELVAVMQHNYEQLRRTKRYRKLLKLYGNTKDKNRRKMLSEQFAEMQKAYDVTWDFCRKTMIPIGKKYSVDAVFALTKAEDVWSGIEKCLYGDGRMTHFSKYGEFPCIRAKQIIRGIPMSVKDGKLMFGLGKMKFGVQVTDRFQKDETEAVLKYLESPKTADRAAVQTLIEDGCCVDTYRPCYATLVPKLIRGRMRVYLHLTIEGKAKLKYNRDGSPRHSSGSGPVGCDIGTQTIAYTSRTEVGLKNLAERGDSIKTSERKERLLYRAMDRSRRATNPQNYNPDGTVRKGRKIWKHSNHYKKLKARHAELCRINAENRRFAIHEDANRMREIGDVFITEPKNTKKLMKRAKGNPSNADGKPKKKRFGRSVKNRCPGGFQATVKAKFESTGGAYIEVPNSYRASQYDHTADDYIKKKLSDRMYHLTDGTLVQRDWYSSFLLYCYSFSSQDIDKDRCIEEFGKAYEKEEALIGWIRANRIRVLNSGIRVA